jgi:hypothetical protein
MSAIERFMSGADDRETLAEVRGRIEKWLRDDRGPSLERTLGLGCRSLARTARRNALLRRAADTLEGTPWARAVALAEAVRAFEIRRWPRWRVSGIPAHASEIDRLLYSARSIDTIPSTARQLFSILRA